MNERGSGWILFAMVALVTAGVMHIFDAIWMFQYNGAIPQSLQGARFGTPLSTYGWIYLVVGIILIASGVGLAAGSQVARWIGIISGSITSISAIWLVQYYPIWSLVYVALGTLVVYALAAYGGRETITS